MARHNGFLRGGVEHLLQQSAGSVSQSHRVGNPFAPLIGFPCRRNRIDSSDHGIGLTNVVQYFIRHCCRDAGIHVKHIGIGNSGFDLPFQHTSRLSPDIIGQDDHDQLVMHFVHSLIRKARLGSSRLFQR